MQTIKVYTDARFEQETEAKVKELASKLQVLVSEFNSLNVGKVQTSDLPLLCSNPKMLYDARLTSTIEVPAGLSREKYIDLLELPSLAKVMAAQREVAKVRTHSLDLFTVEGDNITIIPERLELAKDAQSIYITADGKAAQPVSLLLEVMEKLNRLNRVMGRTIIEPKDLSAIFDTVGVTGEFAKFDLALNPWKLKQFIKNCEKIKDAPTIKNTPKTVCHG